MYIPSVFLSIPKKEDILSSLFVAMPRKSKGRQKIEMARMSKESNLLVTFSKRRSGLFKKASELCTLCGAETAIIVFSPGKKAFSFGHPTVDTIVDRFLSRNNPPTNTNSTPSSSTLQLLEAHRTATLHELNMQLTETLGELEAGRKRGEEINKMRKGIADDRCWWEGPVDALGMQQLEQLKLAMEDLKKNVARQAEKARLEATNHPLATLFAGSTSTTGGQAAGVPPDVKVPGQGLSMTPHGYALGYGRRF